MINTNRIVPVQATDLLSLYAVILKMNGDNSSLAKLESLDVNGNFQIKSGSAPLLATQPVESIDIDATASSVTAATVYFVPAYDYKGFTVDGEEASVSGSVDADGCTLYKAVLATGVITISKVGL